MKLQLHKYNSYKCIAVLVLRLVYKMSLEIMSVFRYAIRD